MTFIKSFIYTLYLISGFVLFSSTAFSQSTLSHEVAVAPNDGINSCQNIIGGSNTVTVPADTDVLVCSYATNTGPKTYETHTLITNPFGALFENLPAQMTPGERLFDTRVVNINSTTDLTANWQVPTTAYDRRESAYDFIDISTTGTALGLADDGEANATMDFPFTLYGLTSTRLTIGNNGAVRFGTFGAQIFADNQTISSDGANNLIAPFWDDIDSDTGDVYRETIGTAPNRVFIVQWHERPHFSNIGSSTFQVKLFETTNVIEFHYQDVQFEDAQYDNGASATVGIGGDVRSDQFSHNTANLSDNFAISYTPVYAYTLNNPTYDFFDISNTGTDISPSDDGEANVNLDFPFTLYGLTSDRVTVGNNGAIRLGVTSAQISSENEPIADDIANNLIAPFWDDIDNNVGNVFHETFGTAPNRVFIVQWHQRGHFNNIGESTFQVKLFETTNVIEFHYLDVQFGDAEFDFGASATVGIGGSVHGDQYSFNTPSITDEFAISYTPIYPYNLEAGTNIYDFQDISATGDILVLDDGNGLDGEANVSLDFPFTLYGLTSQDMTVGNNGAIRFGTLDAEIAFTNQHIDSDILNHLIAPFWDDMAVDSGNVYHQTLGGAPNRVFIVQWHDRPHFESIGSSTTTFQVKLFETTNIIEFHYQDVDFENTNFDDGASATVGIGGSVHGDEFSFNTASLQDLFGIRFTPATIDSASATAMIVIDDVIFANGFE